MAKSVAVKKARRSLTWLGVIVLAMVGLITYGVLADGATLTPKLALDLEGGTEVILAPQLAGDAAPTSDQLNQAVSIIRQRVDASGVSEAQIAVQGGQNIVVAIPGELTDEMRALLMASSKLEFRAVLYTNAATNSEAYRIATGTLDTSESASASAPYSPTADTDIPVGTAEPTDPSDINWVDAELKEKYDSYDCSDDQTALVPDPDAPMVTCDADGLYKYLLGPVDRENDDPDGTLLDGETLTNATAALQTQNGVTTNNWVVQLELSSASDNNGAAVFEEVTGRISQLSDPRNRFAIVLDGKVLEAPSVSASVGAIAGGKAEISGSFTQDSAKTLANQLKFGALPMSFEMRSEATISPTLGTNQLLSGIIAGLIGLLLVVGYSFIQYRALGTLTIASLAVAAVLTYLLLVIMSWRQGYRLSLAGVAGIIVAIGITADSFIVYFERIRDELREGRGLASSVETGWRRAFRTIVASDTVNFIAAAVLFLLSASSVQGFAFTLGLTTIVDIVVVSLFTHPMMQLLATTRFFGEGHRFSGLNPRMLGAAYKGRGRFEVAPGVATAKASAASREAARRRSIAERKAAAPVDERGENDK